MRELRSIPDQAVLKELLDYDPKTGLLTWKYRDERWFKTKRAASVWNASHPGNRAFTASDRLGYFCGNLFNTRHLAHRLIWKWVHGTDPACIDHINGNPSDNRIENLRAVSRTDNQKNMRRRSDNKTGVSGVSMKDNGRFVVRIRVGGKYLSLGTFETLEEAAAVRSEASERYGFHPNHGRAA